MKTIQRLLLLATLGLTVGSCNKFTQGYDVSPNLAPDAPADQQLTAVEISEGFVMSGELPREAGIFVDYFTGADRQYDGLQNYITAAGDYDNMWANSYQLVLTNARLVEEKAAAVQNFQLLGITQVVEAQMIGTVTSYWGDVPYSTAFVTDVPPTFDAQKDIYVSIQKLLDEAIINLDKNGVNPDDRDIFFNGDLTKWQAAAHSLKARYYLHVKDYAQAAKEAKLGIADPAGNMLMPFPNGTPSASANPYWDFTQYNRAGYMSAAGAFAPTLLNGGHNNAKTDESGRFKYFYVGAKPADFDLNADDGAFAADASFPLISYVETQAILAESLQRTGDQAGALDALNAIRAANKTKYGGKYDAYVAADFVSGDALLKEIMLEKYLSLIGQAETFNDVRRTDNLIGVPVKKPDATSIPQRYLLPQSEVNTNPNTPNPIPTLYQKTPVNN